MEDNTKYNRRKQFWSTNQIFIEKKIDVIRKHQVIIPLCVNRIKNLSKNIYRDFIKVSIMIDEETFEIRETN